jgi:PAS domain S-box-containing protein
LSTDPNREGGENVDGSDQRENAVRKAGFEGEFAERLLTEATDAVVTVGPDSTVVYANPSVEDTFGYPPSDLVGQPTATLFRGSGTDRFQEAIERHLTGNPDVEWRDVRLATECSDGTTRVSVSLFAHGDGDGSKRVSGIFREVTDHSRRARELERENEQLRERMAALESQVTEGVDQRADNEETEPACTKQPVTSGGQPTKVIGKLPDTDGIGVYGEATGGGSVRGVYGTVQTTDNRARAIVGEATAASGRTYGVHGKTNSDESGAAGVWAENDSANDSVARGLRVSGYRDVSQTTLSVYLDSFTQTVSDESGEIVRFDAVNQNDWTSSEFDTAGTERGKFKVPTSGTYHVSAQVTFADASVFSDGDEITVFITKNLVARAFNRFFVQSDTGDVTPTLHISKTLTGLSDTDELTINVNQDQGDDKSADLATGFNVTWMTIDKIG